MMDESLALGKLAVTVELEGLDADLAAYVYYVEAKSVFLVCVSDGHTPYHTIETPQVYLDPKQALSLLAWLKQEESTLEKLAKEEQSK